MSSPAEEFSAELESALETIRTEIKAEHALTRYHARAVLVPLGEWTLRLEEDETEDPALDEWAARVRKGVEPAEESWSRAVQEELSLASAEHVQAVDPRFLDHPRYDFTYTVNARTRLEARIRACQALDFEMPEGLLDRVAEADARLAPYLERASGSN